MRKNQWHLLLLFTVVVFTNTLSAMAQERGDLEQKIIHLSNEKWKWMAEKKVEMLDSLFHKNAMFVHMGGAMDKKQELGIIKGGGIHYKHAYIKDVSVRFTGNTTAILLSRITLLAVVGGNEVTNPFIVTEVYVMENNEWKLGSMSFTRLLDGAN